MTLFYRTMFYTLALDIKNYCDIELGIPCNVEYKIQQYYILKITGDKDELSLVNNYIKSLGVNEK